MATLVDNPEYTPNEVYAIASTDPVEGQSVGASFGGLGVDNEPHQQLANRTAWLYGQVNNLNAAVSAIQKKLVKSGVIKVYTINSGLTLRPNAGLSGIMAEQFTFPASSPTGAFCLHARIAVNVSYNTGGNDLPYTTNLGTLQINVHDDTNNVFALEDQGYLLTSGNAGFGSQVSQAGYFLAYYAANDGVQVSVSVGLQTAAYGFPNLYVGQVILTLTAIPF